MGDLDGVIPFSKAENYRRKPQTPSIEKIIMNNFYLLYCLKGQLRVFLISRTRLGRKGPPFESISFSYLEVAISNSQ